MKLLAIGNSFSANATRFLPDLVKSAGGCRLVFGHACIGGCPLEKHYKLAMKHEHNSTDPEGIPYWHKGERIGLKELLAAEKWQVVTIQQYSLHSFLIETYRPWAKRLCAYIRKHAPQAEIVFHQTWAYRADDTSIFHDGFTPAKMYRGLTDAYRTIAAEVGIQRILPVGLAFQLAGAAPQWRFTPDRRFNSKTAVFPQLPREKHSLHAGYGWGEQDGVKHLWYDSHHAGMAGEYLGACVWFQCLFGRDVRPVTFKPDALTVKDAAFLRRIAHAAALVTT